MRLLNELFWWFFVSLMAAAALGLTLKILSQAVVSIKQAMP